MYLVVEVLSGGLTVTTIIMSIVVVLHWRKTAIDGLKQKQKLTSEQWFIIGVFTGFIGQSLDNAYWLMAWSLHYINPDLSLTEWLFKYGVFFNIPFRQIAGLIAAYCHVRAAVEFTKNNQRLEKVVAFSIVVGFSYSLMLIFLRN